MKISIITTLSMLASVILQPEAFAAELAPAAHIASPDHYQILLENDRVLVLKMVLKPGDADRLHHHNDETVYFQDGGQLTITEESGNASVVDIPNGHVMWHPAWSHQVTNTGSSIVTAIVVEEKR